MSLIQSVAQRNRWAKYSNEERKQIGRRISLAKNSPEGKRRAKLARRKCSGKLSANLRGKPAHNKMDDSQKVLVKCLNCGVEDLVVPSIAKTKKFCSRRCVISNRKVA